MPKSSINFSPRPRAEATGRSGIVSRCNNLHTCTLLDMLYTFHTQTFSCLFVSVYLYLDLYLHVHFLLYVCILKYGSISISMSIYFFACTYLFLSRCRFVWPPGEAESSQGVTTFMHVLLRRGSELRCLAHMVHGWLTAAAWRGALLPPFPSPVLPVTPTGCGCTRFHAAGLFC